MRACLPLSLKYSPIAQPEYGARYCSGAASEAEAATTTVYFIASKRFNVYQYYSSIPKSRNYFNFI